MRLVKTINFALAVVCCLSVAAWAVDEGKLSPEERAKAVKLLKDSQAETLAALESLSDEQLKFKPAPDKWSVLEVAEHIMMAETLIFGAAERAAAAPVNPEWATKTKGKTEFLEKALLNRQGKAQAPESIVPTGKLSRAEVVAKYKEARAKTLKFAEAADLPLKAHTLDHPFPIFGTLNAYQWLIYVPLHNMRHNQQIAEVRAHANFPKK